MVSNSDKEKFSQYNAALPCTQVPFKLIRQSHRTFCCDQKTFFAKVCGSGANSSVLVADLAHLVGDQSVRNHRAIKLALLITVYRKVMVTKLNLNPSPTLSAYFFCKHVRLGSRLKAGMLDFTMVYSLKKWSNRIS